MQNNKRADIKRDFRRKALLNLTRLYISDLMYIFIPNVLICLRLSLPKKWQK